MKKILSVVLAACIMLAMCTMLASCAHTCEFSTDWSKDENSHWHACNKAKCEEVADKADHVWDEGTVTTPATQEADGVRTFTCTVCGQTKTETEVFTGFTKEEWNEALRSDVFENFIYTEIAETSGSGMTVTTEMIYKFTKDMAWVKATVAGQSQEEFAPDKASANTARNQLIRSLADIAEYSKYEYDAETKTYKAKSKINIESLNVSTSDVTVKFSEGKLAEIKYSVSFKQNGIQFEATATITISDYGKVYLSK
jgi:hypothetical protein